MSTEIELDGHVYVFGKVSAMNLTFISKRIAIVSSGDPKDLHKIPDEDITFIYQKIFDQAKRRHDNSLVPFFVNGNFTYDDITPQTGFALAIEGLKANGVADFLPVSR